MRIPVIPPPSSPGIPLRITPAQLGFSLIELAIVLFIVALLLGGMLLPLAGQQDIRNYGDTQKILTEARDALYGFAMANDRLPCPAADEATGVESLVSPPCIPGSPCVCTNPYNGFFPAATVGLAPINAQGYLLDGWGGELSNRVRYAVTTANSNAFTTASGMKTTGMTTLLPDLQICTAGPTPPNPTTCDTGKSLATDAVAVIYSLGKNAGSGGAGTDETHNPNPRATVTPDRVFVNAPQGTTFDDQMVWVSKNTLFNHLVAAGRLP